MLLLGREGHVADSLPVEICTCASVALGCGLCLLRSNIVELDDGLLTSAQRAVSHDPELVVPGLTCTTYLFTLLLLTVDNIRKVISLHSVDNNYRRVRIDLDRLNSITLNHLEGHLLIILVEVDLPDTITREV